MKKITSLLLLTFCLSVINAQTPTWMWAKSSGGSDQDIPEKISVDASGNVFMVGYYLSPNISFGSTTLTNAVSGAWSYDSFLVKYSATGSVLWAKNISGSANDFANSVTTDAAGNVYVVGRFSSPSLTFGATTITNINVLYDAFVVKYSPSGVVLWAKRYGGLGQDDIGCITTDLTGNVIVAGAYSDSISFGSINVYSGGAIYDFFVLKLDASGNEIWATVDTSPIPEIPKAICTDTSNNIIITGNFLSASLTIGSTTLMNDSAGTRDVFLTKLDSSGNYLWAKRAGKRFEEFSTGVTTDLAGNIFITGVFQSPTIIFDTITLTNTDVTYYYSNDMFLAKYNSFGDIMWAKNPIGTGNDGAQDICSDLLGNVYVIGNFSSPTISFDGNVLTMTPTFSNSDVFVTKYNTAGSVQWAKKAGGTSDDGGYSIDISPIGEVYVAGFFNDPSATFGSITLPHPTLYNWDLFVAKLSSTTVEVKESELTTLTAYPNPSSGQFYISGLENENTIEVFDISGRVIFKTTAKNNSYSLDLSENLKGLYFYRVTNDKSESRTGKIILQ